MKIVQHLVSVQICVWAEGGDILSVKGCKIVSGVDCERHSEHWKDEVNGELIEPGDTLSVQRDGLHSADIIDKELIVSLCAI
jgi:hypothetical protein